MQSTQLSYFVIKAFSWVPVHNICLVLMITWIITFYIYVEYTPTIHSANITLRFLLQLISSTIEYFARSHISRKLSVDPIYIHGHTCSHLNNWRNTNTNWTSFRWSKCHRWNQTHLKWKLSCLRNSFRIPILYLLFKRQEIR